MSSPLSHNLTRSFAALLALLLFLVGFSMRNFRALSESTRWSIHTYQVINSTLELESTIVAIDSGARGFIVSGEQNALKTYRAQLGRYDQQFRALTALIRDNPLQELKLQKIEARKKRWIEELMEPTIAQRQKLVDSSQQFNLAARSSVARRGALSELRALAKNLTDVEGQLLVQRTAEQENVKWWTQFTLLIGSAFSVLLTVFLVAYASKNARQLLRANAQLEQAKSRAETANANLVQINAQLGSEVAARRAADERLRRSVLDLQRSNAELEQFAYVASHDLQEPLRAVAGCVQVLQRRYEDKLDARAHQFIQHAVEGAQRMQNLIHDLLSYSRLGTQTRAFAPIEGAKIVAAALQSLSVARAESGAQITVDELPTLICDASQIEQVLQNLLSNALKFRGEAPPRIHIGYQTSEEDGVPFHVLWVEDDGLGIEPQYFERIFVMFQRLHTRTQYAGTGIGLAICKKVIERHGGRIWVESRTQNGAAQTGVALGEGAANVAEQSALNGSAIRADHGSKFTFSLPFEPEDRLKALEAPDHPTEPGAETVPLAALSA